MADTELALLIDRLMRRIHVTLHAKAPEFDTERLGPGGSMILLTLAEMDGVALHELTRRVARDKSQMSRVVQSLENKGVVERRASPRDGRVSEVFLTEKGEAVVAVLTDALTEAIDQVMAPISQAEKATLKDIMRRIVT